MAQYATPKTVSASDNLGTVTGETVRQYVINVEVAAPTRLVGDADEIVIKLNGRPFRRLTRHQADRLGLIEQTAY